MKENLNCSRKSRDASLGRCILEIAQEAQAGSLEAQGIIDHKTADSSDNYKRMTHCDNCGVLCAYYRLSRNIVPLIAGKIRREEDIDY